MKKKVAGIVIAGLVALTGSLAAYWNIDVSAMGPNGVPAEHRDTANKGNDATSRAASAPGRGTYSGRVVRIADGDTVTFLTASGEQLKIRLDSIDAPEQGHGSKQPGQPYSNASQDHLGQWLAGKTITARCYDTDQYKRSICDLVAPDGDTASREQVRAGFAWAYTARKGEYLRDKTLPGLQSQASAARRGLWAERDPKAPWQWRYDCWRQAQCDR